MAMSEPTMGVTAAAHAAAVPSFRLLTGVWLLLLGGTALTVWASTVDLGRLNVWTALGIAAAKCSLVLTFFMRLRYEPRFFSVMVLIAVLTLTVFIGLLFFDVSFR
jgi:cytochrome c oxidase subunit 4